MRDPDVRGFAVTDLERIRRELAASLALSRPGLASTVTAVQLGAVERELAERSPGLRMCGCGFSTDDTDWFDGHLFQHPSHVERDH
jgi:hypothetical protein